DDVRLLDVAAAVPGQRRAGGAVEDVLVDREPDLAVAVVAPDRRLAELQLEGPERRRLVPAVLGGDQGIAERPGLEALLAAQQGELLRVPGQVVAVALLDAPGACRCCGEQEC